MYQSDIIKKLKRINMIPTFPDVVKTLTSILENPLASASTLVPYLDPSTGSEILRVANTAYFGSKSFRNINTIEHAIAVIGFEHLSYILLQMPFLSLIEPDSTFAKKEFIKHTFTCAAFSKILSSFLYLANPNETYMAGMLHDIGIIIMYSHFREEWDRIVYIIKSEKKYRLQAEKEVLGLDHGYMGGLFLNLWNIPEPIVESVMFHHEIESSKIYRDYTFVVNIANSLSNKLKLTENINSFDDFFKCYGESLSFLPDNEKRLIIHKTPLYENLYNQLIEINNYVENKGEKNDQGTCC